MIIPSSEHAWRCRSTKPRLNCTWSQTAVGCILICPLLYFLFLFSSSLLPASCFQTKAESCSRCVALSKYYVTCQLNTFQEEPQKLKTFLRTMKVSEDYCDRIITCDRWFIWKWFCADTTAWLLCISLSPFWKSSFWNCKCIRCLPDFFLFLVSPLPPLFLPSFLSLSLTLLSPLLWLVEDVSNLTASDVMNRVNLGYLQGNLCAVYNLFTPCEWLRPYCGERNLSFHQHPLKISSLNLSTELDISIYIIFFFSFWLI